MRFCPKCGEFYADQLLAFCPADGTPLAAIAPDSEVWKEASRFIEQKQNALSRQQRKVKWQRVAVMTVTTLIATMVVSVVVINSIIYVNTNANPNGNTNNKNENIKNANNHNANNHNDNNHNDNNHNDNNHNDNNHNDNNHNGNNHNGNNHNGNNHNGNTQNANNQNANTQNANNQNANNQNANDIKTACADADQHRERQNILRGFDATWHKTMEAQRSKIVAKNHVKDVTLSSIEYEFAFRNGCTVVQIKAVGFWQFNRQDRRERIQELLKFDCTKTGNKWDCH